LNPSRRRWLQQTGALCLAGVFGAGTVAASSAPRAANAPFGALGAADRHGVRVPPGFTARLLATSGRPVPGTEYVWHAYPDGGATFALADGWIYVSNAEVPDQAGGAGALRFDSNGAVTAGYAILHGTNRNCAGGATPWGTWLSCEEVPDGLVFECDPRQPGQGQARPLLGTFMHEAAAIDPQTGFVYLTEDDPDSRFYRFRPTHYGRLDAGVLEAARVDTAGNVRWVGVSPTAPYRGDDTTAFARGEGAWYHDGVVYLTTTTDHRVWAYTPARANLVPVYDGVALGAEGILRDPDNLTVHAPSGTLLVAEDDGELQVILLVPRAGGWEASPLVQFDGHDGSEVAGPAFSPDGTRLYVSSQRGRDGETGMTFEITGPFATL